MAKTTVKVRLVTLPRTPKAAALDVAAGMVAVVVLVVVTAVLAAQAALVGHGDVDPILVTSSMVLQDLIVALPVDLLKGSLRDLMALPALHPLAVTALIMVPITVLTTAPEALVVAAAGAHGVAEASSAVEAVSTPPSS